jgi:hypothetical protein
MGMIRKTKLTQLKERSFPKFKRKSKCASNRSQRAQSPCADCVQGAQLASQPQVLINKTGPAD